MKSDFNFCLTGWFRNCLKEIKKSKNNINYIWVRIKVSGSKEPILLNIFDDKIPIREIDNYQLGDLIKISGYIQFAGNFNRYYLIPTKIELIAKNNLISKTEFEKLDTLIEKEKVLENQTEKDDELVDFNWDKK